MTDIGNIEPATGACPPYRWLTTPEHYIEAIPRLCPEVFIGRQLVVTAIDAGDPFLTAAQKQAGWEVRSGMVYSPVLTGTSELFFQRDGPDQPGFDEWYLFDGEVPDLGRFQEGNPFEPASAPRPGTLIRLVGYPGFCLGLPDPPFDQAIVDFFWPQIDWVRPETYICDGLDVVTFVTRNEALFTLVQERLSL